MTARTTAAERGEISRKNGSRSRRADLPPGEGSFMHECN